jgi:uracil phosphoribosyltransferase
MEKLLLRPNISGHFSNLLTSALTPMIERHIKEILTTSFFQFHSQQSASMHQELMRELRGEISNIKTELGNWHNEALRGQEVSLISRSNEVL